MVEALRQTPSAIAALHTGRREHDCQQQPEGIDQNVTLAAVDLFIRIYAADPAFSVIVTD